MKASENSYLLSVLIQAIFFFQGTLFARSSRRSLWSRDQAKFGIFGYNVTFILAQFTEKDLCIVNVLTKMCGVFRQKNLNFEKIPISKGQEKD